MTTDPFDLAATQIEWLIIPGAAAFPALEAERTGGRADWYSYRIWWIIPISPSSASYTRFRMDSIPVTSPCGAIRLILAPPRRRL